MVAATLPKILDQLRAHEGGYVDHPKDPGGATKWGVTHATYDAWRKQHGLAIRSAKDMTETEYQGIVRGLYWNPLRCDDLPAGVDYAVFDTGWNSGPSRGAKLLQAALGIRQDGKIGDVTIAAAKAHPSPAELAKAICDRRLSFLHGLNTWPTFGTGWARRVAEVRVLALKLVNGAVADPLPGIVIAATGKQIFDIQAWLKDHGYQLEVLDGLWGPKTKAALNDWLEVQKMASASAVLSQDQATAILALMQPPFLLPPEPVQPVPDDPGVDTAPDDNGAGGAALAAGGVLALAAAIGAAAGWLVGWW